MTEELVGQIPKYLKQLRTLLAQKNTNAPLLSTTGPRQNKSMPLNLLSRLKAVSEPVLPLSSAS